MILETMNSVDDFWLRLDNIGFSKKWPCIALIAKDFNEKPDKCMAKNTLKKNKLYYKFNFLKG